MSPPSYQGHPTSYLCVEFSDPALAGTFGEQTRQFHREVERIFQIVTTAVSRAKGTQLRRLLGARRWAKLRRQLKRAGFVP